MNKTKLSILLLVSAIIMLLTSCGGMGVETTDNVTIDLSSVISRSTAVVNYAKIVLIPEGTVTPYPISDAEAFQAIKSDGSITISNIPVGPVYKVYISVGTGTKEAFTVNSTVKATVAVTGGATTNATATAKTLSSRGISQIAAYTGKSVKGAAIAGGTFYTVSAAGDKFYHGVSALYETAAAGFTFNNVDTGLGNAVIISAANSDGYGFVNYDDGLNYEYAAGLAADFGGAINVLNADVFWDDDALVQMTVGHLDGGLVLHMLIKDDPATIDTDESVNEWMPVDLSALLEETGLSLSGQLIKGITVVKKYDSSNELSALWVYMISKVGNFRIQVPLNDEGMDLDTNGDGETSMDEMMAIFQDFITDGPLDARTILNITNPAGDILYIGTDSGLYKASATDLIENMNPTLVGATSGKRIKYLTSTDDYTACVTPLELLIINNNDPAKVAKIDFNEGLPVSGLLTEGVTGLAWDGDVLYVSGNYGVSTVVAGDTALWN